VIIDRVHTRLVFGAGGRGAVFCCGEFLTGQVDHGRGRYVAVFLGGAGGCGGGSWQGCVVALAKLC